MIWRMEIIAELFTMPIVIILYVKRSLFVNMFKYILIAVKIFFICHVYMLLVIFVCSEIE